jgi:hypothetical protein
MEDFTVTETGNILKLSVDVGTTGIAATSVAIEFKAGNPTLLGRGDDTGDVKQLKIGKPSELKGCLIRIVTVISFNHLHKENFKRAVKASTAKYTVHEDDSQFKDYELKDSEIEIAEPSFVASFIKEINFV